MRFLDWCIFTAAEHTSIALTLSSRQPRFVLAGNTVTFRTLLPSPILAHLLIHSGYPLLLHDFETCDTKNRSLLFFGEINMDNLQVLER